MELLREIGQVPEISEVEREQAQGNFGLRLDLAEPFRQRGIETSRRVKQGYPLRFGAVERRRQPFNRGRLRSPGGIGLNPGQLACLHPGLGRHLALGQASGVAHLQQDLAEGCAGLADPAGFCISLNFRLQFEPERLEDPQDFGRQVFDFPLPKTNGMDGTAVAFQAVADFETHGTGGPALAGDRAGEGELAGLGQLKQVLHRVNDGLSRALGAQHGDNFLRVI